MISIIHWPNQPTNLLKPSTQPQLYTINHSPSPPYTQLSNFKKKKKMTWPTSLHVQYFDKDVIVEGQSKIKKKEGKSKKQTVFKTSESRFKISSMAILSI
jgi:hypothetical protein